MVVMMSISVASKWTFLSNRRWRRLSKNLWRLGPVLRRMAVVKFYRRYMRIGISLFITRRRCRPRNTCTSVSMKDASADMGRREVLSREPLFEETLRRWAGSTRGATTDRTWPHCTSPTLFFALYNFVKWQVDIVHFADAERLILVHCCREQKWESWKAEAFQYLSAPVSIGRVHVM